jgi:hypothetical protein
VNRLTPIIDQIDREAEHARRCERIKRSADMYAAAMTEAIEQGIGLSYSGGRYLISDARHTVAFYPCRQVAMRMIVGKRRLERIDLTAEMDVLDAVLWFVAGGFLK